MKAYGEGLFFTGMSPPALAALKVEPDYFTWWIVSAEIGNGVTFYFELLAGCGGGLFLLLV
jgi:hypothetical protein